MIWQEHETGIDGETIYARVDDDGLIRITAVRGYPELDAYLEWVEAGNNPEDFWTQDDELEMLEPSQPKEEETTEQPSSTDTKIETDLGE